MQEGACGARARGPRLEKRKATKSAQELVALLSSFSVLGFVTTDRLLAVAQVPDESTPVIPFQQ